MDITSVYNAMQAPFTAEIDENDKRRDIRPVSSGSRGDTVTFSDESRALAAELAAHKEIEQNRHTAVFARDPGSTVEEDREGDRTESASATGAASVPGDDAAGQIQALETKIKALMAQIMNIMQSALPPGEKMQQAQPFQQEINQLQAQIREIETLSRQENQA